MTILGFRCGVEAFKKPFRHKETFQDDASALENLQRLENSFEIEFSMLRCHMSDVMNFRKIEYHFNGFHSAKF